MWDQAIGLASGRGETTSGAYRQATREGRWGKVRALQRLLTRSHSGKMLAVKRVTENRGKRTPGVDGKIWPSPAARWKGMEVDFDIAAIVRCRSTHLHSQE